MRPPPPDETSFDPELPADAPQRGAPTPPWDANLPVYGGLLGVTLTVGILAWQGMLLTSPFAVMFTLTGMFWLFYAAFRKLRGTAENLYAVRTSHRRTWGFRVGMVVGTVAWFASGGELPGSRQEALRLLGLAGMMATGGFGFEAMVRAVDWVAAQREG